MKLLAIDPGNVQSALLVYDTAARRPAWFGYLQNPAALERIEVLTGDTDAMAVEMIASYGMAVGATTFDTCVWIGRFIERWTTFSAAEDEPMLVMRREVKAALCGSQKAKDGNVRQALIDRFGPGKDQAVGRKATPGPLYGISGDVWSALAIAVTAAETRA